MTDVEIQKEKEGKTAEAPKTLMDEANAAAERLEKANERHAELLRQQEELEAKRRLGGQTDAGKETKSEFTEEEKASRARIKAVADSVGAEWGKKYE
uniref:Uncharacterized protein n=1 Tax=viral metagenome TaxID=1070528 RepID=A0A6H1ZUZ4_9ZZZZ